jgi:hypothetical protein
MVVGIDGTVRDVYLFSWVAETWMTQSRGKLLLTFCSTMHMLNTNRRGFGDMEGNKQTPSSGEAQPEQSQSKVTKFVSPRLTYRNLWINGRKLQLQVPPRRQARIIWALPIIIAL